MKFKNGVIAEMTIFKDGKTLKVGVHEKIHRAMEIMNEVSLKYSPIEPVVTSLNDGSHGSRSWHHAWLRTPDDPDCRAVDFRIYHYNNYEKKIIYRELKSELGLEYGVILESNHIHVEWDPK
jgi:hypothetical protein